MDEIRKQNVTKPSLFDAAVALSDICHEIDNHPTGEFESILLVKLNDATKSLSESIDRRKYIYREAESKIELARLYKQELDRTIKRLERVQEGIESTTKSLIDANPGLVFKDSLGSRITIQNNSKASLRTTFDMGKKTVSNVLCEEEIVGFEIPPHLIKTITYTVLDMDALRMDVERLGAASVQSYPWALTERGTHIRGLRS